MTNDEAIAKVRAAADAKGHTWLEPVRVERSRRYVFFGPRIVTVVSNANAIGVNVRAELDDETGDLIKLHFLPR